MVGLLQRGGRTLILILLLDDDGVLSQNMEVEGLKLLLILRNDRFVIFYEFDLLDLQSLYLLR